LSKNEAPNAIKVIELLNTIPERPEDSFFENAEAAKKFDKALETFKLLKNDFWNLIVQTYEMEEGEDASLFKPDDKFETWKNDQGSLVIGMRNHGIRRIIRKDGII